VTGRHLRTDAELVRFITGIVLDELRSRGLLAAPGPRTPAEMSGEELARMRPRSRRRNRVAEPGGPGASSALSCSEEVSAAGAASTPRKATEQPAHPAPQQLATALINGTLASLVPRRRRPRSPSPRGSG
jgi:hypothetical protein